MNKEMTDAQIGRYILGALAFVILFIIGIIFLWKLVSPQLNLYQANVEKQAQIAEARAVRDSSSLLAEAEVERARGVAEANEIIANSITPEYTRWLYVDQLDEIDGQVIYIPTEAGLPILEAERLAEPPVVQD